MDALDHTTIQAPNVLKKLFLFKMHSVQYLTIHKFDNLQKQILDDYFYDT